MDQEFLIFELGQDKFALPAEAIERIIPCEALRFCDPNRDLHLNIVDVRLRLEIDSAEETNSLLVIRTSQGRVGLQVEYIEGVYNFREDQKVTPDEVFMFNTDPAVLGFFPDKSDFTNTGTYLILLDPNQLAQEQHVALAA